MSLSNQAITALVGYVIVAMAVLIPLKPADPSKPADYNLSGRLLVLATMLIPAALSVYTINCLVQGSCNTWSWINSAIVFLWSLLILGIALYGAFMADSFVESNDIAPAPAPVPAATATIAIAPTPAKAAATN